MALAGDHVVVQMQVGATNYTFEPGDITSVDLGLTYTQHDVTGFGDTVQNFINGQLQAPVTIKGFLTLSSADPVLTGTHSVIHPAFAAGSVVKLTVQVGQNAAPTTSDPEYTGDFIIESYKPTLDKGSAVTFEAMLKPAVGVGSGVPAWGTV